MIKKCRKKIQNGNTGNFLDFLNHIKLFKKKIS